MSKRRGRRQVRLLNKRMQRLERRQNILTREILQAVAHVLAEYQPPEGDPSWKLPARDR